MVQNPLEIFWARCFSGIADPQVSQTTAKTTWLKLLSQQNDRLVTLITAAKLLHAFLAAGRFQTVKQKTKECSPVPFMFSSKVLEIFSMKKLLSICMFRCEQQQRCPTWAPVSDMLTLLLVPLLFFAHKTNYITLLLYFLQCPQVLPWCWDYMHLTYFVT